MLNVTQILLSVMRSGFGVTVEYLLWNSYDIFVLYILYYYDLLHIVLTLSWHFGYVECIKYECVFQIW
jgi:hypothetical protein